MTSPEEQPRPDRGRRRLSAALPDRLDPEQRDLYDAIIGGPRGTGTQHFPLTADDGTLNGPFEAMLLNPALGTALQALGTAVRYGTGLPGRLREMAILLVAAHWDSQFEEQSHAAIGRSVGLDDEDLAALREGRAPASADEDERAAHAVVRALLDDGDLDDDAYAAVVEHLGEEAVFELSTLVGYYALLALQLRVFRVDP